MAGRTRGHVRGVWVGRSEHSARREVVSMFTTERRQSYGGPRRCSSRRRIASPAGTWGRGSPTCKSPPGCRRRCRAPPRSRGRAAAAGNPESARASASDCYMSLLGLARHCINHRSYNLNNRPFRAMTHHKSVSPLHQKNLPCRHDTSVFETA